MGCFVDLLLRCFGGCFGLEHHDRRRSPKVSPEPEAEALEKKKIAKQLGRPDLARIETILYEDVILNCQAVMNPGDIQEECDSHLDNVTKQSLFDQLIVPLWRPELFLNGSKLLAGPRRGVVLHGPPLSNTGKATLLATAKFIAKDSGAVFISARKIANLITSSFSDYDAAKKRQLISAVFSLASKLQPAVIYINDMDGFLGQLSQTNMKTEFLDTMDGFFTDQKHGHAQVLVLAATSKCNRASPELDEAIKRHFQVFEIRVPWMKERAEILKLIMKGERVEENIDYDHVAALTEGYEASDLYQLCKKAAYNPIRDYLQYEEKSGIKQSAPPRPMSQLDLENVVIAQLIPYLNKLLQQATIILDQTHNEKHHHQLKQILSSLGFSYRGKDDSNVMEKRDGKAVNDICKNAKRGKHRVDSVGQTTRTK
ncbi:hypothetical protein ACLB2K_070630 [Fragaria x ananassa]